MYAQWASSRTRPLTHAHDRGYAPCLRCRSCFGLVSKAFVLESFTVWTMSKARRPQCVGVDIAAKHPTPRKFDSRGRELAKAGERTKDLAKCLLSAGAPPWTLDGDNVLRLGDGGAQAVRRTEELYGADVMEECVLAWKREPIGTNTSFFEDSPKLVKAREGGFHIVEVVHCMS